MLNFSRSDLREKFSILPSFSVGLYYGSTANLFCNLKNEFDSSLMGEVYV